MQDSGSSILCSLASNHNVPADPPKGRPGTQPPFFSAWLASNRSLQPRETRTPVWAGQQCHLGLGERACQALPTRNLSFSFAFYSYQSPESSYFPFLLHQRDPMSATYSTRFFSFAAPCSLAGSDLKIQSILMAPSPFLLTLSTRLPLPLQNQDPRSRSALASTNRHSGGALSPPLGGGRDASRISLGPLMGGEQPSPLYPH